MSVYRVARRYAEAAYELAEERKLGDGFSGDLELIQGTVRGSREFVAFLKSPVISKERKRSILALVFKSRISDFTFGFLNLLVEKGREDMLGEIAAEYFRIRDERHGLMVLEVRAATEMTGDQQKSIIQRFASLTGKKIRAAFSIDKQLRGGFVARVGDTVYDGSILRQLELLRNRFREGTAQN